MDKNKKRTLIIVAAIEVVVIIFCLIVSIIVMTTIDPNGIRENNLRNGPFISTFQNEPILFGCAIVLPLFIIFVVDGVYLIMYATKRESMLSMEEKNALLEEAKKQAREEALAEIRGQRAKEETTKDEAKK